MKIRLKIGMMFALIGLLFFNSCDHYFNVSTDDILDHEDTYRDRPTVYAGLIGLSDIFREVVEHHVILAELLGDLMTPTSNAPDECWEIYRFGATNGNSFASPQPYYKLIVNCNDFLRNVIAYNKNYPEALATNVYRGMISTALTYRAWAYLQVGKLYGEAVYYDLSLVDVNGTVPSKVMKLDELVPELIYNLKTGVDGINAFQTLDWKTVIAPLSETFDQMWNRVAIDVNVLLTELYLWDKDYTNAVKTGLNYVNQGENFKLNGYSGNWYKLFPYKDFKLESDHYKEVCTLVPYDFDKLQTGKMQYYFSSVAPNVCYFRPHTSAISRFRNQIRGRKIDEITGEVTFQYTTDFVRLNGTITYENGQAVVGKYHRGLKNYDQDAPIYVYRAAEIYLMIAEALSGLGGENNIAAADSLVNVGLKPSWKKDHYEQPFDAPIYTSSLNGCRGIRGRVSLEGNYIRYHVDTVAYPGKTEEEKILKLQREKFVLDSLLCEETALELAYEGKRWFTLMRIARNTGCPELLAQPVAAKFNAGEKEVYERWLMDPKNWFIKWDQTNVYTKESVGK